MINMEKFGGVLKYLKLLHLLEDLKILVQHQLEKKVSGFYVLGS